MSNLINRLRERQAEYVEDHLAMPPDMDALDAADEIERLTAEVANLKEQLAAREAKIQELESLQELNSEALETTESALLACQAREGELREALHRVC